MSASEFLTELLDASKNESGSGPGKVRFNIDPWLVSLIDTNLVGSAIG